jgi:excisionase family DNA binding protein
MASAATLAFLHARGLEIEPKALNAALRAAVAAVEAVYYPEPGQEGLTVEEIRIARSGGFSTTDQLEAETDPLVEGVVAYASLLGTGLTTTQAAKRLGVSDARIRQRLAEHTLVAVREGRVWKLPVFQFTRKGELPGWSEVCSRVPPLASPVALERWLTLPHPDLVVGEEENPVSPREWLLAARPPQTVAELAAELA